jgi:hypothetical protein
MKCFQKAFTPTITGAAIASLLLILNAPWSPSAALDLKITKGALILEGKIETGDHVSLRNFLSERSNFEKMNGDVFLASQGGNVIEALKIGYLIRHLRLTTDAPSRPPPSGRNSVILPVDLTNPRNYQCTSACFLLYVAGIYRHFVWAGRLGIHRPQVEHKPIGTTEKEISAATDEMRDKIKLYLETMDVPDKYLGFMYSIPPNEVHWLTQAEINSDLKGYVPEIRALLETKCDSHFLEKQSNEIARCIAKTNAVLRAEAWNKIFRDTEE